MLALGWADVDVAGRTLTIDAQHGDRQPLKTERSRRTVAITSELARELAEHRLAAGADEQLVFTRLDGSPYTPRAADRVLRRACKAAGIAPAPTCHDLRHSHVSMLLAAGRDPAAIAARIGDSVATVLSVYAHEYDAARRRTDESDELAVFYGSTVAAQGSNAGQSDATSAPADLALARAARSAAQ